MDKNLKVIISGGGTGGHIYPAIAIANKLKERNPSTQILFIGANNRMEMKAVPVAGYDIIGLPIVGLQRKFTLKNLALPFKYLKCVRRAKQAIKTFAPDIVIGVGGYASAPTLKAASGMEIPTLLQEQNSYAGLTNKILAKKAKKICVAYKGMEQFFPAEKIILTGNPVRQDLFDVEALRCEAFDFFKLDKSKKTLLVVGGSLGALTLNTVMQEELNRINNNNIQVIWQTGKHYFEESRKVVELSGLSNIKLFEFIGRMDLAYAAADIIVSRAGAGTISELCIVAKPCILVPSPNVAEDHQNKNAMALVNEQAAVKVNDIDAKAELIDEVLKLFANEDRIKELKENISKLALPNAAEQIVDEILKLLEK